MNSVPKLPVNNFEWVEDTSHFYEDFIKNYNEESDKGYFLEVDVQYTENYMKFIMTCQFLPERMKIEKAKNPVANLHDEIEYVIHIRNLKQALNYWLVLRKSS